MRWTLLFLSAAGVFAQGGTDPKPKPEDYEAHSQANHAALGAEFTIHSFEGQGVTYVAPDFLVVEVAVYPAKGKQVVVQAAAFSLRLNGKKSLSPAGISLVASSLQHPEWRPGLHTEAGAGGAGGMVVVGAPRPQQPYPGQTPQPGTTPQPVPGSDQDPLGNGAPRAARPTAEQILMETALPEGQFPAPVSGYLYFPFRGKASSLKTVELLFEDAVLQLR